MLPKAKELAIDFEALGQRMLDRKKQLLKDGIPPDAEHAMVAKTNGKTDSPMVAARQRKAAKARPPAKVTAARKRKTSSSAGR